MAVPKKRTSPSARNMRRSHDALKPPGSVELCPDCRELKLRHQVCPSCGTYRGRTVVEVEKEG